MFKVHRRRLLQEACAVVEVHPTSFLHLFCNVLKVFHYRLQLNNNWHKNNEIVLHLLNYAKTNCRRIKIS